MLLYELTENVNIFNVFCLVINGNRINRFHLFWDTLYMFFDMTKSHSETKLSFFEI